MPIDRDPRTEAADLRAGACGDMLEQRHADRKIAASIKETGELGGRRDRHQRANRRMRHGRQTIEPDRCAGAGVPGKPRTRSEEHTSELQSLMRISYAVFCLKKKNIN